MDTNTGMLEGEEWQSLTEIQKLEKIWLELTKDKNPGSWPLPEGFLIENLNTSFDNASDLLPKQGPFHVFHRKKVFHSVGVVAKGKFISLGNHNFTGIFKGSNCSVIRLSTSLETDFIPGVSLKFFRNNYKSANIVCMYSLLAQKSLNFFRHDVSNHPPNLSANIPMFTKVGIHKFLTVSPYISIVGLSDVASVDENGIKEEKPIFPFKIILHPLPNIRDLFPDENINQKLHVQLQTLTPMTLYDIYAEEYPFAKPVKIGYYEITTSPITSSFGDNHLFYQHQRFDDDIVLRPEWEAPTKQILEEQHKIDNYTYADIQDN